MSTFIKGYQVVENGAAKNGIARPKAISRLFMVRDAADEFCKLARSEHPDAYVRTVHGYEVGINNSAIKPI